MLNKKIATDTQDRRYKLTHYSYCGMYTVLIEAGSYQECRERAAKRLRWAKRAEYTISIRSYGFLWEMEDPEDAMMVSDGAGNLEIEEYIDETAVVIGDDDEAWEAEWGEVDDLFDRSDWPPERE